MTNSKNKYLIASDLDGTLLTDNKKIRLKTRKYLKKLQDNGNIVIFATGRPVRTAIPFYNKVNLKSPLVCYNGSYCFNPSNPIFKPISFVIKKEIIVKNYKYFKEHFCDSILCESLNNIYCEGKKEDFYFTLIRDINSLDYMPKITMGEIPAIIKDDVLCFILHSLRNDEQFVNDVRNYVKKNMPEYCVEFWDQNRYFEIRPKGINKASTIKMLQKLFNINDSKIITFGDSINDFELVTSFENGFAMINGKDCIKTNNITKKDNNHNGVVFELKSFFKSKD